MAGLAGLAGSAGSALEGLAGAFGLLGLLGLLVLLGSSIPTDSVEDPDAPAFVARDRRLDADCLFLAAVLRPDLRSRVVAMSSSSSTSSSTLAAVHEPPSSLVRAALR